jgi:hypothetical protein
MWAMTFDKMWTYASYKFKTEGRADYSMCLQQSTILIYKNFRTVSNRVQQRVLLDKKKVCGHLHSHNQLSFKVIILSYALKIRELYDLYIWRAKLT